MTGNNMPRLSSIRTTAGSPSSLPAASAGNVSVDDLLEHTWHYQCVVSPTFSAAALASALISASAASTSSTSNGRQRPPPSVISPAATSDHADNLKKVFHLKISRRTDRNDDGHAAAQQDLHASLISAAMQRPARSLHMADLHDDDDDDHPLPLLRLRRERIAASTSSYTQNSNINQDGYVSLASFINSAASSDTSPTAETPHKAFDLFNFRKHHSITNKPSSRNSTIKTCRDKERRSVSRAADPSRISFYAGYLTVD